MLANINSSIVECIPWTHSCASIPAIFGSSTQFSADSCLWKQWLMTPSSVAVYVTSSSDPLMGSTRWPSEGPAGAWPFLQQGEDGIQAAAHVYDSNDYGATCNTAPPPRPFKRTLQPENWKCGSHNYNEGSFLYDACLPQEFFRHVGGFITCMCLGRHVPMCEYFTFLSASQLYFTATLNEVSNYLGCWLQKSEARAEHSPTPKKENNQCCRRCARQKLEGWRYAEKVW